MNVFQFKVPNEIVLCELDRLLASLKVSDVKAGSLVGDCESDDYDQGKRLYILKQLKRRLFEDYAENQEEEKSNPWSFEYVVELDPEYPVELQVMTRLFSDDPTEGNIFYGHRIFRLDEDHYWICLAG